MVLLGILSILQMVALPGLLLWRALRLSGGVVLRLAVIFGLSLLSNFLVVFLMTALGLYLRAVLIALIGLEILALAWMYRSFWSLSLAELVRRIWDWVIANVRAWFPRQEAGSFYQILLTILAAALAFLALTELDWAVRVFRANLGTVFNSWDAVVSWNRWAVSWSQNQFPIGTANYPQILPANWSISYVLLGNSQVQLFAKAIIPLFTFMIFLGLFDLGLASGSFGYWIGIVLTQLMIKKFVGEYIAEGYADLPVACLGFLAIYPLLRSDKLGSQEQIRGTLMLSAGLAAAAALTKQAGLYLLLAAPVLAFLFFHRQIGTTLWQKARPILVVYGIAALIVAPWYIYKQVLIVQGIDYFEVPEITGITGRLYSSAGLIGRFLQALLTLDKYVWLLPLLAIGLPMLERRARWVALVIVFPFFLFWAGFASYDTRNLTLALPFLGMSVGLAVEKLIRMILVGLERLKVHRLKLWVAGLLALAGLASLLWIWPAAQLEAQQVALRKQIFNPGLNEQLYAILENAPPEMQVLTNYPIAYLPGLEQRQANFWFADYQEFIVQVHQPQIGYILMPSYADDRIVHFVEEKLARGEYRQLFEDEHYVPYRMIQIIQENP